MAVKPYARNSPQGVLFRKLQWLILFRAAFAAVLLGSTLIVGVRDQFTFISSTLITVNGIGVLLLFLSLIYKLLLHYTSRWTLLAYGQIGIDSLVVTVILFVTGGLSSIFSFLYLVVIIYASMTLFRPGGLFTAFFCSVQYGVLVALECQGVIYSLGFPAGMAMKPTGWEYVAYRLVVTTVACFGVAFLTGILAEQERRAKQDLWAMEAQVKRVEKLAAIGEMASGLAHEIKNPLASLSGSIQFLREEIPYEAGRDRLMEIILREAARLSALVNDFLIFAKPQPGKPNLIDLEAALEDIVKAFMADNRRRRLMVSRTLEKGVWVEIDPEHLRQVIWNLLLNADEAIEGQGRIDIRMFTQDRQFVCITITDNGCGMTEDVMSSIFDPFFTVKPKGTGLGLSIVQRLVTAFNGLIDVQSAPGRGTTFTLKLRRHPEPGKRS